MSLERNLAQRVAAIPYWYHRIDLGDGLITPGWAPLDPQAYRVPDDLRGMRVLDIGAWDGYWTFEALRRGAEYVVAIDDFSDAIDIEHEERRSAAWETFDLCRSALRYTGRCERLELSAYDVPDLVMHPADRFDLVMCFGVLYHCRHPLLLLDRIAEVLHPGGQLCIETAICDDYSPYRGGHGGGHGDAVVCEFYPTTEYSQRDTNWWVPTLRCLHAMLFAAGYGELEAWKLRDHAQDLSLCRGFAHGVRL